MDKNAVKPFRHGESEAYEFVLKRIRMNEPCAILSMSGLGKRMLFNSLQKYAENNLGTFLLKPYNVTSSEEFKELVDELEKIVQPTVLLLKISYNGDCSVYFEKLNSLRVKRYTDFLPIIMGNVSNAYVSLEKKNKLIGKSLFILQPNSNEDLELLVDDYEKRYGIPMEKSIRQEVFKLSGGHTGFLKSLYLKYCDEPEKELETQELIKMESFLCWIEDLLTDLPEEKILALNDKHRDPEDAEFLERFGYLNLGKVFSPIFETYLQKILNSSQNKGSFENSLSAQETELFANFKTNVGTLISRDDIAKTLWKDEWVDKFSDWSIDQAVYRIRKKLKEAKQPYQIITRKGMGFVMEEK